MAWSHSCTPRITGSTASITVPVVAGTPSRIDSAQCHAPAWRAGDRCVGPVRDHRVMKLGVGPVIAAAVLLAACAGSAPPPQSAAPSDAALPSSATAEPEATPGPPPGTTPFPTPGPTITPGSTRVIGTIVHADGSPAEGVCVVLEKGICPIATDDQGTWFTDIPAGPLNWNFIYKIDGQEAGRQFLIGSGGGELRLPRYTLTG